MGILTNICELQFLLKGVHSFMEEKLSHCVFCGENPDILKGYTEGSSGSTKLDVKSNGRFFIHCKNCHSHGPEAQDEKTAIFKWNNRQKDSNDSCPFCNSIDLGIKKEIDNRLVAITCNECISNGPFGEDYNEAMQKWKNRI